MPSVTLDDVLVALVVPSLATSSIDQAREGDQRQPAVQAQS